MSILYLILFKGITIMSKKSLVRIIGMSSIFFSTVTLAATNKSLSKDEWLTAFKELAPSKMCRRLVDDPKTNTLLQNANINYDKCVTLIPASFDKCQTKFYSELPQNINDKNVSIWSKKLGNCIGLDFYSNNLLSTANKATPPSSPPPATTSPTIAKPGDMSKEEWLNDLTLVSPKLICGRLMEDHLFHKKLTKKGITTEKCLNLMPNSIAACEKELSPKIPMTLDKKNQDKWSRTIGKCIGATFAKQYLK